MSEGDRTTAPEGIVLQIQAARDERIPSCWSLSLGRFAEEGALSWIAFCHAADSCQHGYLDSVKQRRDLFSRLSWPFLSDSLQSRGESNETLTIVYPAIEGESLLSYLERVPGLAEETRFQLALDLLACLNCLAAVPRLLSNVELDDFFVIAKDGVMLTLRFCPIFSVIREEESKSDYQIAGKWLEILAQLHQFGKSGGRAVFRTSPVLGGKAFKTLFKEWKSGRDCPLRDRVAAMVHVFTSELGRNSATRRRRGRLLGEGSHPEGPLSVFLNEKLVLAHPESSIQPKAERDAVVWFSPFLAKVSSGADSLDRFAYLFPADHWFDHSVVDSVNRRLSHPFLKSHHNGIRVRSVFCDENLTVLVTDPSLGIPLPALLSLYGGIPAGELLLLAGKLHRALAHFDSADFSLVINSPWQIEIHRETDVAPVDWTLLVGIPLSRWPPWEIKIRVERPPETLSNRETQLAWNHIYDRLSQKFFPALCNWILDWERFEVAAEQGSLASLPLSPDGQLEALFLAAGEHLENGNTKHREKFLDLITEGLAACRA